jgi:hypothetical protein
MWADRVSVEPRRNQHWSDLILTCIEPSPQASLFFSDFVGKRRCPGPCASSLWGMRRYESAKPRTGFAGLREPALALSTRPRPH